LEAKDTRKELSMEKSEQNLPPFSDSASSTGILILG
jgi:hypothetical protein